MYKNDTAAPSSRPEQREKDMIVDAVSLYSSLTLLLRKQNVTCVALLQAQMMTEGLALTVELIPWRERLGNHWIIQDQ